MIYNSNPYKRKMESMHVNVAPSVTSKAEEPTKPAPEQVKVQESMPEPMVKTQPILKQPVPYVPATPEIDVMPYVPEVEGVEVPEVSLDDLIPNDETADDVQVEEAQPEAEAPAEEVAEEAPVVESSELSNPEQVEEVVEVAPIEEAAAEASVDAASEETEAAVPATHYFYCTKPDGKEVVYKRNTASASYESEINSFRKYLEKEGIIINREEIK